MSSESHRKTKEEIPSALSGEPGSNVQPEQDKGAASRKSKSSPAPVKGRAFRFLSDFQWIPNNWSWPKLKPVLRSAIAAWVAVIVFLFPKVEEVIGQATFLMIIASFLSPPSDSFPAVLHRESIILSFVGLAWAWSCLGLKLANLARTNSDPSASFDAVFSGQYIQAAPTVIIAVFIFFGCAFFLYIKSRTGPSPFMFPTIFSCICIDISLSIGLLFPYPFYRIGGNVFLPLAVHSALALLASILVLPSTASAQFTNRFQGVLAPLSTSLALHRKILKIPTNDPAFSHQGITAAGNQSEGALVPLAISASLLKIDIIWCRFSPLDFAHLLDLARRLAVQAHGMDAYFTLIDPTREKFSVTPAPSAPGSTSLTPKASRPPSPTRSSRREGATSSNPVPFTTAPSNISGDRPSSTPHMSHARNAQAPSRSSLHTHSHLHFRLPSNAHNLLHSSLLHLALSRTPLRSEQPVGVLESQWYLKFEATHFSGEESAQFTRHVTALLNESCDELLMSCETALKGIRDWFSHVRDDRFTFRNRRDRERASKERIKKYEDLRNELLAVLDRFRIEKRHRVLDPYRSAFDPKHDDSPSAEGPPPHRYLFNCYVYQYHLMEFAVRLHDMLAEINRLETERKFNRLWIPTVDLVKLLSWNTWEATENMEHDDEENPETIPGMRPTRAFEVGIPQRRDPDALPPANAFETLMNLLYKGITSLGRGNVQFALKTAILTILLCLPSFLKSSAKFAYDNRFVWGLFMGQLTISRFRGETTFGFFSRIWSTFSGGIVGMLMWYISSGSGRGNAYGIAVATAVCFPFFFYARFYWPGPPVVILIFFVTAILVFGYSYQSTRILVVASSGYGFSVAWRRFVTVAGGVAAASIFSYLPPSTTIRSYHRIMLSTTCSEIGAVYCSILSHANSTNNEDAREVVQSLIAIRSKLKRSLMLRENVVYEFSFRGRWPIKRYHRVLDLQIQIAYCLSDMLSVIERLEPAWKQAFLRRTRFLDTDFQGDVLAVINMIATSLRTGTPLPQITPCPLVDRFTIRYHGLNVIHKESEDDYGLPRTMTIETLENEQYLMFSVGVSTAFGFVTRLDKLMVAVKELVGEHYHIRGLDYRQDLKYGGVELESQTNSGRP